MIEQKGIQTCIKKEGKAKVYKKSEEKKYQQSIYKKKLHDLRSKETPKALSIKAFPRAFKRIFRQIPQIV